MKTKIWEFFYVITAFHSNYWGYGYETQHSYPRSRLTTWRRPEVKFGRNVVRRKKETNKKNYKDKDKKSAIKKNLILRLRKLISKRIPNKDKNKDVWLNSADCFFFKIFTWRRLSLLMSWSSWQRKYPMLAQAFSAISLVIFGGCVRLLVAVLFIFIWSVFFLIYMEWAHYDRVDG